MYIGPTTALFGGTRYSAGFHFCLSRGIQPSICNIKTVPDPQQTKLLQVDDLIIECANSQTLVFPQCLLEEPVLNVTPAGIFWRLRILDRRWKWRFGRAYGHFNIPLPPVPGQAATYIREMTPQLLATSLFGQMGELGYDISRMPNDQRPEVHWDGENPAQLLEQLCDDLGCVICYDPFADKVTIWPIGQGAQQLPPGPTSGRTVTDFLPAKPKRIIAESAPTLFQAVFKTEAVGEDVDGTHKPIDQLSYAPKNGKWKWVNPWGDFEEITGTTQINDGPTIQIRDLARRSVFRQYRITGLFSPSDQSNPWTPLGYNNPQQQPQKMKDLKFYNVLVDQQWVNNDQNDGGLRPKHSKAYVKYWDMLLHQTQKHELYTKPCRFDTERCIVTFDEAIWLLVGDEHTGGAGPADVLFETSFNAGYNGILDRVFVETDFNEVEYDTPDHLVYRKDVKSTAINRYTDLDDEHAGASLETNLADVNLQLEHWTDAEVSTFVEQPGASANYKLLMPFVLDGCIHQITWSGGGTREAETTVSIAHPHNRYVASYGEQSLAGQNKINWHQRKNYQASAEHHSLAHG
jgi:hypothetical protein